MGKKKNQTENGKPEIVAFDNGLLFFKKGYKKNGVEKGEMVGNDHAGTKGPDLLRYMPFHVGNEDPHKREK